MATLEAVELILSKIKEINHSKVRVTRSRHGDEWVSTPCPLAQWNHEKRTDRRPSSGIIVADDGPSIHNCFHCGSRSLFNLATELHQHTGAYADLIKEVAKVELVEPSPEYIERAEKRREQKLALYGGVKFGDVQSYKLFGDRDRENVPKKAIEEILWEEHHLNYFQKSVPQYIIDRGLSIETCAAWEIMWDPYEQRIIFPVRRYPDRGLVGVIGRSLPGTSSLRYMNYWEFKRRGFLYGEHNFIKGYPIIIVEGMVTVPWMWQRGYPNVMAIFGSKVSDIQVKKLKNWESEIIVIGDGDKAGKEMSEKIAGKMRNVCNVFLVNLPEETDPDSLALFDLAKFIDNREHVYGDIGEEEEKSSTVRKRPKIMRKLSDE